MLGIGLGLSNITGGIGNIISRILSALKGRAEYFENKEGTVDILKPLKERELLDKASIVLTPTAYSDGFIHTSVPQYKVLPTELVTNADFDSTSNWTASTEVSSFTVSDGIATIQGTADSFNNRISQSNISIEIGKKYEIKIKVKSNDGGIWFLRTFDSVNSYLTIGFDNNTEFNTYTFYYTAKTTIFTINLASYYTSGTADMSVDFISLKEIQEADFDFVRATTATRVNENGLIEEVAAGIPRIDYSSGSIGGSASVGQWLFEPSRLNLVTYSEDFNQWTTQNSSINGGYESPDGNTNSFILIPNESNIAHAIYILNGVSASTQYCGSIFVKNAGYERVYIRAGSSTPAAAVFSLIDNGSVLNTYGTADDAYIQKINNGWYKVTLKATTASVSPNFALNVMGIPNSGYGADQNSVVFSGDGTSGIYIWGAQVEAGSYPTSYIPTSGTTKTRNADVANNSGNADLFNDSEGVLYAEIAALANDGTQRLISVSDGGASNYRVQILYHPDSNLIRGSLILSVSALTLEYTVSNAIITNKVALKYKSGSTSLWINGAEVDVDATAFTLSGLNELSFDRGDDVNPFYGNTKSLIYFPEALTDLELETVTSWSSFELMAADLEYTI